MYRIKNADIHSYFWLGSSLTNPHLPESVLSTWLKCGQGGSCIGVLFGKIDGFPWWLIEPPNKPGIETPLCFDQINHKGHLLWMDEILHHLSNHETPLFVGICRGINIPGFLRWCEMDFATIHSMVSCLCLDHPFRLREDVDLLQAMPHPRLASDGDRHRQRRVPWSSARNTK